MIDKVLCPYCGAEMMLDFQDDGYEFGAAYYVCQECGSTSPTANTDAAALAAAQARYLPPNRPLTLEEVKALDADEVWDIPCFVEIEPNWYAQVPDDGEPRLRADAICKEALGCNKGCETCNKGCETYNKGCETYNKLYRVWLRKPTQAEMDAAGWGGDATDD